MTHEGLVLKGSKVLLREKRIGDAPDDFTWSRDRELARLDAASPLSISFTDFLILYTEELEYPSPCSHRFAIDNLENKHIGNCSYYDINLERKESELGIMIGDRAYWGQGFGTDALATLLHHLFQDLGLERAYLHTLEWNMRAQRAFTKCGFVHKGKVHRNGHTLIRMEVTRQDFLARPVCQGQETSSRKDNSSTPALS